MQMICMISVLKQSNVMGASNKLKICRRQCEMHSSGSGLVIHRGCDAMHENRSDRTRKIKEGNNAVKFSTFQSFNISPK